MPFIKGQNIGPLISLCKIVSSLPRAEDIVYTRNKHYLHKHIEGALYR